MALPKRRHSSKRRGTRRATHIVSNPTVNTCKNCGEVKKPHAVCQSCGFYRDKHMIQIKEKKPKK